MPLARDVSGVGPARRAWPKQAWGHYYRHRPLNYLNTGVPPRHMGNAPNVVPLGLPDRVLNPLVGGDDRFTKFIKRRTAE